MSKGRFGMSKAKKAEKEARKLKSREWKRKRTEGDDVSDLNVRHRAYYSIQLPKLLGKPENYRKLVETFRKDLVLTFRLADTAPKFVRHASVHFLDHLESYIGKKGKEYMWEHRGSYGEGFMSRLFTGEDFAWKGGVANRVVSENKGLAILQTFLTREVNLGHIVRQEFVSMLPARFCDVKKGDVVLDMCAAPGNKTQQLLELTGTEGCVVGNDADVKRIDIIRRRLVPQPQLVLTRALAEDLCQLDIHPGIPQGTPSGDITRGEGLCE